MAKLLLAIGGRVEAGEVLSATVFNTATGTAALTGFTLQWQVWNGSTWANVGAANALTLTIPNNASAVGLAYRLVSTPASQANEASLSAATSAATQDKSSGRAPTLADVATSLTVAENAPATLLDGAVTFNDQDNSGYGGGSLTILNTNSLSSGGDGQDLLSVRNQGTGAGQVSFNPATGQVYYSTTAGKPVLIGQVDAALGGSGTDLRITFNASATKAMVDKLIENIVFSNNDNSPTGTRLITIKVADGTGGTVQRALQVNVTASADAPVLTSAVAFAVNENQTAAGTVAALDPDREATAAQGITYSLVAGTGSADNALFTIDPATGALTFNTAPDREGTHGPTYLVRVRATDSGAQTAEQAITITVNNVNEAPVAAHLTASTTENGAPLAIAASHSDPDGGGLTVTLGTTGTVGTASFDPVTGHFAYDTAGRFESLPAGATATDTFTYTVTDAGGLSVTRSVTVTVQGANDAPAIDGEASHTVTQGPLTGNVFAEDVDGDGLTFSGDVLGDYGAFTIDPPTGAWVYIPDPSAVGALGQGQQATETITVTVTDAHGASAQMDLLITVVGSNDAPQVSGGTASGAVAEDGTQVAQGQLVASDADAGDTLAWSGNASGAYGSFAIDPVTGAWTYTLDNQRTATQMLGSGESVTERFTVTLSDAQGAGAQRDVVVTVSGANDAPFVHGQAAHTVSEAETGRVVLDRDGAFARLVPLESGGFLVVDSQVDRRLADGSPDASFAATAVPGMSWLPGADAQGRPLLVREGNDLHLEVLRLGSAGGVDTTFGGDGFVRTNLQEITQAVVTDSAGRLLVAGLWGETYALGAIERLTDNGSPDTSFGVNGHRELNELGVVHRLRVEVDGQDRLLVYGARYEGGVHLHQVMRLFPDGSLDTSFGSGGVMALPPAVQPFATEIDVHADGSFVFAWDDGELKLARFTSAGQPDAGFGYHGLLATGIAGGAYPPSLELDALGRIVLAGSAQHPSTQAALTRYLPDGSTDASFGTDGVALLPWAHARSYWGDGLSVAADGSILVSGAVPAQDGTTDLGIVRLEADGTPDGLLGAGQWAPLHGDLHAGDIDGDALTFSGNVQGEYGAFSIDPSTGEWVYDPDPAAVRALSSGQQATETITVTVTDVHGAGSQMDLLITVVGANDAPWIVLDTDALEGEVVAGHAPGVAQASGTLQAGDADELDTISWSSTAMPGVYGQSPSIPSPARGPTFSTSRRPCRSGARPPSSSPSPSPPPTRPAHRRPRSRFGSPCGAPTTRPRSPARAAAR